jgi:hypothetical protein
MTPLTPRQMIDGALLSIWEHVRRIYWLPGILGLFFCVTGSTTLLGVCCSIVTATLFCVLLAVHGTACSLTAKTLPGALVPTFLFPLLVNVGIVFLIPIFRQGSGPILWIGSAFLFVATWFWVRRRTSTAVVAARFIAVHLALASLATLLEVDGLDATGREEYPIALINPAYMAIRPLVGEPYGPSAWFPGPFTWFQPLACYWVCLAINIFWARRWLIRHFERLVERTDRSTHPGLSTAESAVQPNFRITARSPPSCKAAATE